MGWPDSNYGSGYETFGVWPIVQGVLQAAWDAQLATYNDIGVIFGGVPRTPTLGEVPAATSEEMWHSNTSLDTKVGQYRLMYIDGVYIGGVVGSTATDGDITCGTVSLGYVCVGDDIMTCSPALEDNNVIQVTTPLSVIIGPGILDTCSELGTDQVWFIDGVWVLLVDPLIYDGRRDDGPHQWLAVAAMTDDSGSGPPYNTTSAMSTLLGMIGIDDWPEVSMPFHIGMLADTTMAPPDDEWS